MCTSGPFSCVELYIEVHFFSFFFLVGWRLLHCLRVEGFIVWPLSGGFFIFLFSLWETFHSDLTVTPGCQEISSFHMQQLDSF
jgi:hypothetical protein